MANIHTFSDSVYLGGQFNTAITAATNTPATGLDTLGFRRAVAIFQSAPSGTGTTSDCKVRECDTLAGSYADVTSAAFTQVTTVGAAAGINGELVQLLNIDLSKRKRFLKLVHTGAGGSAAGVACGSILLIEPDYMGTTNDQTAISV